MIATTVAENLLRALAGRRVVVVGDVMLDSYVVGDADRLSPEAPVPVVRVEREFDRPGGAANVAANVRALGAEPVLIGAIGADATGARLHALLRQEGIDDSSLIVIPERATAVKTRVICRGQQVVRFDRETTDPLPDAAAGRLAAALKTAARGAAAVIYSDYAKGVLTAQSIPILVQAADDASYTCADPVPQHMPYYRGVIAVTPNEKEARAALGDGGTATPEELARGIADRFGIPEVFVTLGPRGLVWRAPNGGIQLVPTRARQVFDVSGAGDTVVAVLAALRGVGADLDDAAQLANLAAGLVVEKVGTATATPSELLARLASA